MFNITNINPAYDLGGEVENITSIVVDACNKEIENVLNCDNACTDNNCVSFEHIWKDINLNEVARTCIIIKNLNSEYEIENTVLAAPYFKDPYASCGTIREYEDEEVQNVSETTMFKRSDNNLYFGLLSHLRDINLGANGCIDPGNGIDKREVWHIKTVWVLTSTSTIDMNGKDFVKIKCPQNKCCEDNDYCSKLKAQNESFPDECFPKKITYIISDDGNSFDTTVVW